MDDSLRLTILKRLTEHLEYEVNTANGYKHTLKDKVFRGRMTFDEHDPIPMVSILENLDPDRFPRRVGNNDGVGAGLQKDEWIILVQGWTVDDKKNPTDPAYELMADVKKALAKILQGPNPETGIGGHPNYHLQDLISGMTMEPGTVRPPMEQPSTKAFFWMRIVLNVVEDITDPYKLD